MDRLASLHWPAIPPQASSSLRPVGAIRNRKWRIGPACHRFRRSGTPHHAPGRWIGLNRSGFWPDTLSHSGFCARPVQGWRYRRRHRRRRYAHRRGTGTRAGTGSGWGGHRGRAPPGRACHYGRWPGAGYAPSGLSRRDANTPLGRVGPGRRVGDINGKRGCGRAGQHYIYK